MPDTDVQTTAERIGLIVGMVRNLSIEDVDAYVDMIRIEKSKFDTLTAMVDPTAWMGNRESMNAATNVVLAFGEFRHVVEENVNPDA